MVNEYGIPLSLHQDRSSVLKPDGSSWTQEEKLRGRQDPTQVGWALQEFGVEPIYALSPRPRSGVECDSWEMNSSKTPSLGRQFLRRTIYLRGRTSLSGILSDPGP